MGSGLLAAVISVAAGLAAAVFHRAMKWRARRRALEDGMERLTVWLWGRPPDERTGEPAVKGWATKIDKQLDRIERRTDRLP